MENEKSGEVVDNEKITVPLVCNSCFYSWDYGGTLERATCPNCGAKVRVIG